MAETPEYFSGRYGSGADHTVDLIAGDTENLASFCRSDVLHAVTYSSRQIIDCFSQFSQLESEIGIGTVSVFSSDAD